MSNSIQYHSVCISHCLLKKFNEMRSFDDSQVWLSFQACNVFFYVKRHSIDANYLNQLEEEDSHHKGCPFWLSGLVTNHCNKNDSSPSVTMSKDTTQESWSASESTVYMKSTSSQSIQTFESGHVKEENARLFISMSPFIAPHSRLHQLHAILSS